MGGEIVRDAAGNRTIAEEHIVSLSAKRHVDTIQPGSSGQTSGETIEQRDLVVI